MTSARLPPLTALRAFESAGRALSFTRASDELGVTPGAISRQIRVLEDYLGLQLFVRSGREVSLTQVGREYLEQLSGAFAQIRSATALLTSVPQDAPLRVSTSITFTLRWLMPRLISFHSQQAGSNLQLTMSLAPVDFQRDDLDASVKLGHESTPHAVVRKLFDADLVPVCSPTLIERHGPLHDVGVLDSFTLLHSTARPRNWELWLAKVGRPEITGAHRLEFESSSLAYQAAIEGVGFAMAQLPLILEELRSGRLVIPFPVTTADIEVYNLIWPNRTPRNPRFAAFRDWMTQQAAKTTAEVNTILEQLRARREGGELA